MTENGKYQLHAFIKGRVQGVGYRYQTLQTAQELGLSGWVRNLRDGRVEVLAEGEHEMLNQFLMYLRKGTFSADVRDVDYVFNDPQYEFDQFHVRGIG